MHCCLISEWRLIILKTKTGFQPPDSENTRLYDSLCRGSCLWVPTGEGPGDFQIVKAFGL